MKLKINALALSLATAILSVSSASMAQTDRPDEGAGSEAKVLSTQQGGASGSEARVLSTTNTKQFEATRQKLESEFKGMQVDEITATPFANLLEVRIGNEILYVNQEVDFVLQGALVDVQTRTDLTAQRLEELNRVDFSSLPLEQAIRYVKGDGSRKIAVFEDPNCIYCKRLHESLAEVDNITVYSLLFPILSPDSLVKAESIWCADDNSAAWQAWMLKGIEPTAAKCANPIKQTLALGMSLGIEGTPAIIFSDGSRVGGWLPPDQLKDRLDSMN
ncbi:DsbC family protein [Paenalcaligenes niemegkensis]|uniref:DsbC family protein n=1 Tax=Paenalcaligenes niemegkensis TaxID=2895469 RepID=UPI001EE7BD48|nr:DsbC family protein [Paenalcaligenes niemegkensis]MCQ9617600.1 DsbC family protein [Paenalcaligenes niemegkensis]